MLAGGVDRLPGRLAVITATGAVLGAELLPVYGNGGYPIKPLGAALEPVPFRLTRGLATALGHAGLVGGFAPLLVAGDRAVFTALEALWPSLALLYRDNALDQRGTIAQAQGLLPLPPAAEERHAHRRTLANVNAFVARVVDNQSTSISSRHMTAAPCGGDPDKLMRVPVYARMDRSLAEDALAKMPAGWHAWW